VSSIEYRAANAKHWKSLDLYLSTGFLKLSEHDHSSDRIRLRDAGGGVVYTGGIDALSPSA
jgi:hypothetical protein